MNINEEKEEKKEIFVRNISYSTKEEELQEYFEKFGKVLKVKILEKGGRSKGTGFVEFETHEDAEKVINENLELDVRKLGVDWAGQKKERDERKDNSEEKTKTIFVGNLCYDTTEEQIEEFFGNCGKILSVRIAKGDNDKPKGFCHIDFENEEDAENALQMNGKELDGRTLRVDKTLPRGSEKRRDFRGRGRDFHGGRGRDFRGRRDFGKGRGFRGRRDH